jgi:hypothetical protein
MAVLTGTTRRGDMWFADVDEEVQGAVVKP